MRQFRIEPEVFSILPHLEIGAVALRGIDNRAGGGDSAAVLQAACARLRERLLRWTVETADTVPLTTDPR